MQDLTEAIVELIRRTSTDLPADVEQALREAREREAPGSAAQGALDTILLNTEMSRRLSRPICQDTGTPIFEVYYPEGWSTRKLAEQIRRAVAIATERAYLRPNAVDAISGENSGDNTGVEFPTIHFHEWDRDELKVDLMLKGGGCENVGAQYSLPYAPLKAGRDLEGVRRVVLDAVHQAQGQGCAPGVLGVAIGGDRSSSYQFSKQQLFRPLGQRNPDPELARLEETIKEQANALGIGPMGFGGQTTVLDVQIDAMHRLPASFFVSVSYMCWANRRRSMTVRGDQVVYG
ncbi:MAG: fumarate hydratase [Caldilineales bacterium]|nr:fumarate hydratase [Caldilineales bacterium]MDW8317381.1 fumarate hydratase [Anaerolineae bacterium]